MSVRGFPLVEVRELTVNHEVPPPTPRRGESPRLWVGRSAPASWDRRAGRMGETSGGGGAVRDREWQGRREAASRGEARRLKARRGAARRRGRRAPWWSAGGTAT